MAKLRPADIKTALTTLPTWKKKRDVLVKTFKFEDFAAAMKFVNAVARSAERANHHPDIEIQWNKVTLSLTTHDQGGLTEKDVALAKKCDQLAS